MDADLFVNKLDGFKSIKPVIKSTDYYFCHWVISAKLTVTLAFNIFFHFEILSLFAGYDAED